MGANLFDEIVMPKQRDQGLLLSCEAILESSVLHTPKTLSKTDIPLEWHLQSKALQHYMDVGFLHF